MSFKNFLSLQNAILKCSSSCKTIKYKVKKYRQNINRRGGVEDTRLEAKAKDTKKIRGQGQPYRGQTLSRPRTQAQVL